MYQFLSKRNLSKKIVDVLNQFSQLVNRLENHSSGRQDEFLTINEAAAHCKVTDRTLRRWKVLGFIKPVFIGRTVHYSKNELRESAIANKLNKK